ncbi:MAG: E2/UBC family protein [Bacteroidia bacterium]
MRRQFHLPETDADHLDSLGLKWETVQVGGNWLLIHGYPVPTGYNSKEVTLALRIDAGYPISQIDMVYFSPGLHRLDGQPIGALAPQIIDGIQFQRWSRHRTDTNPWRPEIDDVSSHLFLVDHWLEREFKIR